ncbi:hypothetical protein QGN29_05180 [Temperatibacter marinus]|uniref:Uncharacterized protein n=1 Tax=Temperatibacter marinus TaxID=1456591 RepID=A0AA52EE42_9PROT|nr:hypothetical protein [Temperatibacter marinus]WND03767.1 hypothetical protein QGN29_05180 [Temperatibacter marinus]
MSQNNEQKEIQLLDMDDWSFWIDVKCYTCGRALRFTPSDIKAHPKISKYDRVSEIATRFRCKACGKKNAGATYRHK